MGLNISNETNDLVSVILGIADEMGKKPSAEDCIDPKTKYHIINNSYPKEEDCKIEIENFNNILFKNGVEVLRPNSIQNLDQIFTRDIAFVVGNKIFVPEIIESRNREKDGIKYFLDNLETNEKVIIPEEIKIEGGDIIIHNDFIFIGYSDDNSYKVSRTSPESIQFIQKYFPDKEVLGFNLFKDDDDPYKSVLHLDCAMQPVGKENIIIYEEGFKNINELDKLKKIFGKNNMIQIDENEMYQGFSNIFSISNEIVVSDSTFTRLNSILKSLNIKVEEVYYREISKFGGLFRCSTLPINRSD
tara:strand:+ start:524 stop:1429 length:906 start_codon:yes stop_codon:yes gene_type:complete